jgi:hypothetical protein
MECRADADFAEVDGQVSFRPGLTEKSTPPQHVGVAGLGGLAEAHQVMAR